MSTLTTNGSLAFSEIELEYDVYQGSSPFGINGYYDADPYHDVPVSGTISVDDMRGTSKQTVRIEAGESSDSATRYGFSEYQGSSYYVAESGESAAAFGTESRTADVLTDTTDIRGIVAELSGYMGGQATQSASAGSTVAGSGVNLLISINTSTTSGWSNCSAFCDSLPHAPGSVYNPWGGGTSSTYQVADGYGYATTTTSANTVYTFPRQAYGTLPAGQSGTQTTGYFDLYHTKALSNTNPSAYGIHYSNAWNSRYNWVANSFFTGHQNKYKHAAQMLYSGARADELTGSGNEVYFYFY